MCDLQRFLFTVLFLVTIISHFEVVVAYVIPPLKIEAFSPKGLRISLPDSSGTQVFAFNGNVDRAISTQEGDISFDITPTKNNSFVYYNPDIELIPGNTIHYWVYVQNNGMNYRKDGLQFRVEELKPFTPPETSCLQSSTTINQGSSPCKGKLIFEDHFDGSQIDLSKWTVEHRIPTYSSQDFPFNSYISSDETVYIRNSVLFLNPVAIQRESEVRGELDLRQGCTGHNSLSECCYTQKSSFFLPPVKSARIFSKLTFKYGKVEIRCKLPAGDWIYPELFLEGNVYDTEKFWIAYSRGNDRLTGNDGSDIGSRLLFGGPVLYPHEPERSTLLRSERANDPYYESFHTYGIVWDPEKITFSVDNRIYGTVTTAELNNFDRARFLNKELRIALGVSVGGITHFPDGFKSNQKEKPWNNKDRDLLVKFFEKRSDWSSTWKNEESALQIDYIKVWAI